MVRRLRGKCPLIAAIGVSFLASAAAQEKPVEAWWLTAVFPPAEVSYESLPVASIDAKWVKMSVLSYANLPMEAKEDVGWMRRGGFLFRADNQFKGNAAKERTICGVYEDRDGKRGRFLLVLKKARAGPWRVAYLHQEPGQAGFSVLVRKPGGLYWGTCMRCSEFSRLRWKKGGFSLDEAP